MYAPAADTYFPSRLDKMRQRDSSPVDHRNTSAPIPRSKSLAQTQKASSYYHSRHQSDDLLRPLQPGYVSRENSLAYQGVGHYTPKASPAYGRRSRGPIAANPSSSPGTGAALFDRKPNLTPLNGTRPGASNVAAFSNSYSHSTFPTSTPSHTNYSHSMRNWKV